MSKKLLLTLLPLAFLVAACGGGSQPAPSSSEHPTGLSGSDGGTSSHPTGLSVSSDIDDPSTSDEDPVDPVDPSGDEDPRAYDELLGEGYEIKIGNLYYTLVEQEADPGRNASYNITDVDLEEGDLVSVYLDGGDALAIWAEADADNGVYPNYDERPQSEQYTEFTITETATGSVYFHINSDDSYSIWITPTQSGEGGDVDPGEGGETDNKYAIYSVSGQEKIVDLVLTGTDPAGKDQAQALGVSLSVGDVIQLYDNENQAGWITTIEGWSFGGDSGSSTAWQAYLEAGTDSWTVLQDVTVDIYAKFQFNNDSIYFGISTPNA